MLYLQLEVIAKIAARIAGGVSFLNERKRLTAAAVAAVLCLVLGAAAQFQASDPGVRQGTAGAGGMRADLPSFYQQFFTASQTRFS
jgi:hypothetical protein